MEGNHNCVMCRRGFYHGRYQEHILRDDLPSLRPELAAYIQENAVLEVCKSCISYFCLIHYVLI